MKMAELASLVMVIIAGITLIITILRDKASARAREEIREQQAREDGANWQGVKAQLVSIESVAIDTRSEVRDMRQLLTDHTAQIAEIRSQGNENRRRLDKLERRCERCLPFSSGGTD